MAKIATVFGLILDIVGVLLLFCFSPEKFPDPQWSAFFAVEGESRKRRDAWVEQQPRRRRTAFAGVALIVLGFVFQILGELVSFWS